MQKVNLTEKLRYIYYAVTIVLAIFCLLAALLETDANPGLYGALIVLLFTSIVAIENVKEKPPKQRFLPAISWLGFLVGAYLWLADEANAHPTDWGLLVGLILVWLLAAVIVVTWLPLVLLIKSDTQKGN